MLPVHVGNYVITMSVLVSGFKGSTYPDDILDRPIADTSLPRSMDVPVSSFADAAATCNIIPKMVYVSQETFRNERFRHRAVCGFKGNT